MDRNKLLPLLVCTVWIVVACSGMLQAQNVVTDWNAIASTTIVKNAGESAGCQCRLLRVCRDCKLRRSQCNQSSIPTRLLLR